MGEIDENIEREIRAYGQCRRLALNAAEWGDVPLSLRYTDKAEEHAEQIVSLSATHRAERAEV